MSEPTTPDAGVAAAVDVLRAGGLVAFPTETVYGLGADATNRDAVLSVFRVKQRPLDHPLIVHIGVVDQLERLVARMPDAAVRLAAALWPGPLTLVLELRPGGVVPEAVAGGSTVAVRFPSHPVARSLLGRFGGPVVAPSANRFGHVSPTRAAHVRADLGDAVDMVLDGGPCAVGVESTIVDCVGDVPVVRRLGAVGRSVLSELLHGDVAAEVDRPGVSGTLERHYAPRARVLVVDEPDLVAEAGLLCNAGSRVGVIAPELPDELAGKVSLIGRATDDETYAHELYAWLRAADAAALDHVVAVRPAPTDLGAVIVDRLRRASRPAR